MIDVIRLSIIEEAGTKCPSLFLFWIVEQDAVVEVGSTTLISSAFYSPTQLCGGGTNEIEF